MRIRDSFGATATVPTDADLWQRIRGLAQAWHAQVIAPGAASSYSTAATVQAGNRALGDGIAAATKAGLSPASIAEMQRRFNAYVGAFARLVAQINLALMPPEAAQYSCMWAQGSLGCELIDAFGVGRSGSKWDRFGPSARQRLRMCLESAAGLQVAAVQGYASLNAAAQGVADIIKIPFANGYGRALNRWLGVPDEKLYAWEDGHLVTLDSPEAEWYWANDKHMWTKTDFTGQLAPGAKSPGCDQGFWQRIATCSIHGWDWCNVADSIGAKIAIWGDSGGQWWDKLMATWGGSTSVCIAKLKTEILMRRNIWCWENGIQPPTFPEIGVNARPADKPDLIAAQYLRIYGSAPPATQGQSPLAVILAGAAAGFAVGGPPGAGVGAILGVVLGSQKK